MKPRHKVPCILGKANTTGGNGDWSYENRLPQKKKAEQPAPASRAKSFEQISIRAAGIGPEARSVGQACGDNRLPIVIPCHRVVAANGIGGFAHATGGYLLEAKRWLLAHECGADAFELTP